MAITVLILSAVTIGAVTGVLPVAGSKSASGIQPPPAEAARVTQAAPQYSREAPRVAQSAPCRTCGVVESIRTVEVPGETSGLGVVAGGLTGAVVGSQLGRGSGRTVMTIAGAAGGAYAGNAIEKNVKKRTVFRIAVRLDNGTVRSLTQSQQPPFAIGERVRIVNGASIERA